MEFIQKWTDEFQDVTDFPTEIEIASPREDTVSVDEGMMFYKRGDISAAISTFQACLDRNPEDADTWYYLARAYIENDEDDQALTCLVCICFAIIHGLRKRQHKEIRLI